MLSSWWGEVGGKQSHSALWDPAAPGARCWLRMAGKLLYDVFWEASAMGAKGRVQQRGQGLWLLATVGKGGVAGKPSVQLTAWLI